jgi:hypothetical protein
MKAANLIMIHLVLLERSLAIFCLSEDKRAGEPFLLRVSHHPKYLNN